MPRSAAKLAGNLEKTSKSNPPAARRRGRQRIGGKSSDQRGNRRDRFEARDAHADALMDAARKRQMSIGRAAYVEFIRRGELFGVAIGGANAESDLGSCRQIHTAKLHGLSRNAIADLVGTFVAP